MASSMTKRNQARNEQALQELLKSVPGNDRCADCEARNPGWASWSLGIFLCMRCAALHRKLGTHISKVKSLSMDAWTNEQVESMKTNGNVKANEVWNAQRKKATMPLDVDEVDSAMERYIRQKYEQKAFIAGAAVKQVTRAPPAPIRTQQARGDSPVSLDENPPPPPPKSGRKFGFGLRSASSGSFLSRNSHKEDKQKKSAKDSPTTLNKQSRVFGATIGVTESEKGLELKLIQLKEMGFPDTKRNTKVLMGNGGDLERTIESLVKLGASQETSARASSPVASTSPGKDAQSSNGASITRSAVRSEYGSPVNSPQTARSNNPFENQSRSATSAFDAAMANMTISTPTLPPQQHPQQQNLFPNATGGHIAFPPQLQQAHYQQPMTPPIPQATQFVNNPFAPQQQPMHNPFMPSQPFSPSHSAMNPYANPMSPNPYLQQTVQSPMYTPHHSMFPTQQPIFSPHQQSFQPPQSPAAYYNPYQQPTQQMTPQQTGRLDKNSIMALYNQPQLSATPTASTGDQSGNFMSSSMSGVQSPGLAPPQRSATMPLIGSKNPFTSGAYTGPA